MDGATLVGAGRRAAHRGEPRGRGRRGVGAGPGRDGRDGRAVHDRRHRRLAGRRHRLATRTSRSSRSATRRRSRSTARPTPVFGTISAIGLLSTSDTGVAAYPVTVAVTGDQEGLHDGVSADVEARLRAPHRRAHRARASRSPPRPTGRRPCDAGRRRRQDRRRPGDDGRDVREPHRDHRRAWPRATRSCSPSFTPAAPAATGRQNQGDRSPRAGVFQGGPGDGGAGPQFSQQGGPTNG